MPDEYSGSYRLKKSVTKTYRIDIYLQDVVANPDGPFTDAQCCTKDFSPSGWTKWYAKVNGSKFYDDTLFSVNGFSIPETKDSAQDLGYRPYDFDHKQVNAFYKRNCYDVNLYSNGTKIDEISINKVLHEQTLDYATYKDSSGLEKNSSIMYHLNQMV